MGTVVSGELSRDRHVRIPGNIIRCCVLSARMIFPESLRFGELRERFRCRGEHIIPEMFPDGLDLSERPVTVVTLGLATGRVYPTQIGQLFEALGMRFALLRELTPKARQLNRGWGTCYAPCALRPMPCSGDQRAISYVWWDYDGPPRMEVQPESETLWLGSGVRGYCVYLGVATDRFPVEEDTIEGGALAGPTPEEEAAAYISTFNAGLPRWLQQQVAARQTDAGSSCEPGG
ncbi:MAG: hypothetical protein WC497_02290 [Patescibacteria group bacterium]